MGFILALHGEVRWLVVLVAAIAIIKYTVGYFTKSSYSKLDRQLMIGYALLLVLNLVLGLILLVGLGGGWPANRLEHAATMILAIVIAARASSWAKLKDAQIKYRNNLIVLVLSLALIFVGVIRLRGGWIW